MSDFSVHSNTLAPGTYTFYFGVDLVPDAFLNDPIYYDYLTVIVN